MEEVINILFFIALAMLILNTFVDLIFQLQVMTKTAKEEARMKIANKEKTIEEH